MSAEAEDIVLVIGASGVALTIVVLAVTVMVVSIKSVWEDK